MPKNLNTVFEWARVRTERRSDKLAGISLLKRRAWFAEGDGSLDGGSSDDDAGGDGGAGGGDDLPDFASLPASVQAHIKELRAESAKWRNQLREVETSAQKAQREAREREQKRLAEQGEFKTLAEKRAEELAEALPFKERAELLEGRIRASNEKRVERVPEAMKTLIPTGLSPEQLSDYLDRNFELLTKKPAPSTEAGAGAGVGGASVSLTPEQKQMASRMNMTDEQYKAQLGKMSGK